MLNGGIVWHVFAGPAGMVNDVKYECTDLSSIIGTKFVFEIDSFAL